MWSVRLAKKASLRVRHGKKKEKRNYKSLLKAYKLEIESCEHGNRKKF